MAIVGMLNLQRNINPALVDTGDYLSDFGENMEAWLKANRVNIKFKDREPDVKHDFPRGRDPVPNIRIIVPRATRDFQDGVLILRLNARLILTAIDINDQANEIESWSWIVANMASGERVDQRNYWQTDDYMVRVYVTDVELFMIESESGAIEISSRIELMGEKQL